MMILSSRALAALLLASHCVAQQVPGNIVPYDNLGLSSACFDAVNSTVSACPAWILAHTGFEDASFDILRATQLNELCGTSCQADLAGLRQRVASACTQTTDVMVPDDGIAYPATFIIDRFLYAASLSCLKDSSSGEYCDVVVAGWIDNDKPYTKEQECSSCQLEIQAKQLGSPFGYDEKAASNYASITSSCAVTKYTYAKPTGYAINATSISPSKLACNTGKTYTIQEGDSCNLIAKAQGVSTPALINLNNIDAGCDRMPPVGTDICLPLPCTIYQIEVGDSCGSIVAQNNITMAQFLAWNPAVSAGCTNLGSWRGGFLCTSSPLGTVAVSDGDSATTEAPMPTDAKQDSNTHCGKWYSVVKGDTCASISVAFTITLDDFYFLNPHVDNKCSNLWLDTSYCVKPVGNIQTYPDYPIEVPSTSFPRPAEPTQEPVPSFSPPKLNSRAPDTVDDCDNYVSAWPQDIIAATPEWNSCDYWASFADVRVVQLLRWNPSLKKDDCVFLEQYSYCVLKKDDMNDAPATAEPSTTTKAPTASTAKPTASSTGSPSTDGMCGANGKNCLGSGFGDCCSSSGYCGNTTAYCGAGCQSGFGVCSSGSGDISTDGLCGTNGMTCKGSGYGDCCSAYGYCGVTAAHCDTQQGCQEAFGDCPTGSGS